MKLTNEFAVAAPRQRVWDFFHDVPAVVQCLPGAEITGQDEDGNYLGVLSSKLGPISIKFEGKATVEFDDAASTVTIKGAGVDKRGGSRGSVNVVGVIGASGTGTSVALDTDVTLSGAAARFGRTGLIADISEKMISQFASCIEAKLLAAQPEAAAEISAPPPPGLSVVISALWARFTRLFRRKSR